MIITISTHKGGAGKTMTATNLAASLAKLKPNKNVCLIDFDGQCGVSIVFGKEAKKYTNKSLLTILTKSEIDIKKDIFDSFINEKVSKQLKNLTIIYGEPKLTAFDHILNKNEIIGQRLVNLLKKLDNAFDYIIIDTPPSLSTITLIALKNSDLILTPFEPERQNIEGALNVIEKLNELALNNKKTKILLIPTKVNANTSIHKNLLTFFKKELKDKNYQNVKMSNTSILNSIWYQSIPAINKIPLILTELMNKRIIKHKNIITDLTKEILEYIKE